MRKITRYAKENRKKKTPAEKRLFKLLLLWKIRFRSQRMIDYYIVDFFIPERWLIIELDGGYYQERQGYDKRRDLYISKKGYVIKRFPNEVVFERPLEIKNSILDTPLKPPPEDYRDLYGTSKY